MKYEFIHSYPEYPVTKWATLLNISTSGYYDWLRTKDERDRKQKKYVNEIKLIFNESANTYGVDRICGVLRRRGYTASFRRVKAIMKELGLVSIHRRRRQRSLTDSRNSKGVKLPNLVRGLKITKPFQVITSDISYIRTVEGFEYVCSIKDVASGIVLAQTMSDNMKADLVIMAIKSAKKRWNLPAGCIHHSDRGSQYTAESVVKLLREYNLSQSFSRVGKPGDNAWSESYFANLKKETIHWRHFQSREEARQTIFAFTEGFYNTRRVQKRLGYLSPIEWLNRHHRLVLKRVA